MSIVRAARDDTPASHLPSPAVAVPQPRRPEPAAALPGNPHSAARTASAAAPRRSSHAARPATPSRQHVRAVLTGVTPQTPLRSGTAHNPPRRPAGRLPVPGRHPPRHRPAKPGPGPAQRGTAGYRADECSATQRDSSALHAARLAATAVRPCSAPSSGLRLTRRGRLVLSVFALALILGLITILWASLAGGAQAASGRARTGSVYQGLHRVTVLPGQTLWTIARQAEPSADPRTVIPEIMQINAISSTNLQPGQQLWVPRS